MSDAAEPVTVPDEKTTLGELLARVKAGEELLVTRGGTPIARLVPEAEVPARPSTPAPADDTTREPFVHPTPQRPRQPGLYAGLASIGPDFFEPLPEEELRLWEGGDDGA